MISPLIPARVEKGKILWSNPVLLANVLHKFNGKEVRVSITEPKNTRSLNQNNYYWGVVIEILADFTGYIQDEMHEVLKGKFLSDEKEIAGEQIRFSHSTAELNTTEFEEYLKDIREWASVALDCFIPLPNEVVV